MNWKAIWAIYASEMTRFFRTLAQSFLSPVLSTSLYFVVFGAAIGSRIDQVDGVSYAAFIVPGLVMLSVITQSITNGAFGIYSRNSSARSMSFCLRRSISLKLWLALLGRPQPRRCLSGW